MSPLVKQTACAAASVLVAFLFLDTSLAQLPGEWEVRVNNIIKKPPRDDPDTLNSKFIFEYRYEEGIPPKRFLVANGFAPEAFPQTLQHTTFRRNSFDMVLADIYEVCPDQFTVIEEDDRSIGVATLRMDANIGFPPSRRPGKPFHQLIVHDWGDLYEGLDGVSVLHFGTALDAMVMSAGHMMRDLRCADATAEECVDIITTSIRALEPTEEEIDLGIHGGQEFHACPGSDDNSPAADDAPTPDDSTTSLAFTMTSTAFDDNTAIPLRHACTQRGGENISPALSWSNAPSGTETFALLVDDEVPPCGSGDGACRHWQVYNIPSETSAFEEGQRVTDIPGVTQGRNWNQTSNYAGPCPPNEHVYTFTIYALGESAPIIMEGSALTRSQFQDRFEEHILDAANLRGLFAP